ncbi:hypothetical protein [Kitasatospora sp. NPDC085879]|uniref:hypothetical protein n=1 Tax=Kitasatospora sp. NPDC085879 TaxID=3154769 RepID=UPI003423F100
MHLHPEISEVLDRVRPFDPLADPAATRAYLRELLAAKPPADDPRIAVDHVAPRAGPATSPSGSTGRPGRRPARTPASSTSTAAP